jgi:hypothetical protein
MAETLYEEQKKKKKNHNQNLVQEKVLQQGRLGV